jgi:hypothetical protein
MKRSLEEALERYPRSLAHPTANLTIAQCKARAPGTHQTG